MKIHILTLFPDVINSYLAESIPGRAARDGLVEFNPVNIRDYTQNKHGRVDDYIYGGGAGMLICPQPVYDAWKSVTGATMQDMGGVSRDTGNMPQSGKRIRTIYVTPQGEVFSQKLARELAEEEELILLCGHYEGIDERVLEEVVTDYVSIGDYVLTGGELAALVMTDAIVRLLPGVLHNDESAVDESIESGLLEYPQYSRPAVWHDREVPAVLLSGHHENIKKWRKEQALSRTRERRPDLYESYMAENPMIPPKKR